jgi:hypothetical protein
MRGAPRQPECRARRGRSPGELHEALLARRNAPGQIVLGIRSASAQISDVDGPDLDQAPP